MAPFPFRTVGFDLDGTLVDSAPDLAASVNHALAGLSRPTLTLAHIRPMIGGGARRMLAHALEATGGADEATLDCGLAALLAHYAEHLADATRPFAHLIEALDALQARGVTLAVATNKREAFTRDLLARLGLIGRFACVIGGDTLGEGTAKPAPDMLLAMVERCGGPAAFVGDSRFDVEAARAAGLPVVACSFGYRQEPVEALGADAVIDSFAELVTALEGLSRTAR